MSANISMSGRRGAASVIFAITIIPILGLCGLAVDYGQWARIDSNLTMAANAAALNAVKVAANAEVNNDPNAAREGDQAGAQWFAAQAGPNQGYLSSGFPNVATQAGATVTSKVTFSGRINSIFGRLFGVAGYPVSGEVAASLQIASYLHVEILLDNSPSMAIGASDGTPASGTAPVSGYDAAGADIGLLEQLSPCWPSNALYKTAATYPNSTDGLWQAADGENYWNYQVAYAGNSYTGNAPPNAPHFVVEHQYTLNNVANFTFQPTIFPTKAPYSFTYKVPGCVGGPAQTAPPPANALPGVPPLAGPPCAFACHYDNRGNINTSDGNDLYAMARQQWPRLKLRFDLVKQATQDVITQMQKDDLSSDNLQVGVFSFDQTVHQQYPVVGTPQNGTGAACVGNGQAGTPDPSLEAGGGWAAAKAAVGGYNGVTDTGIPPVVALLTNVKGGAVNNDDTNIEASLNCLATSYLTPVSTDTTKIGVTAATPAKVLFLVTDGFDDYRVGNGPEVRAPITTTACNTFKNMGYHVYVVYTPYYQVKHQYFFDYMYNDVVPPTSGGLSPLAANLRACATDPDTDFISATDQATLTAALQTFLRAALNNVARFNM
jgi:Flp pilus assembly protein TadG